VVNAGGGDRAALDAAMDLARSVAPVLPAFGIGDSAARER